MLLDESYAFVQCMFQFSIFKGKTVKPIGNAAICSDSRIIHVKYISNMLGIGYDISIITEDDFTVADKNGQTVL